MLLNIGKQLPSVQNDFPVMNTQGSLNSPVVNTLGSLSSPVVNTLRNLEFTVMNTLVSRLLGVLRTSTRTGHQKFFLVTNSSGVETTKCIHHRGVLPTWCILPRNMVFVIPRNEVLIPCDSEDFGRVHSVTRNKTEQNGIPQNNEVLRSS